MRRTMHAAVFFLASASLLHAQTPSVKPLPPLPATSRSVLTLSAEVHDDSEVAPSAEMQVSSQVIPPAKPVSFIPRDSGRPYSQLAGYMSCNEWSPNLWNGYSCERAAKVAVISQHVDMQCKCFDCKKSCLHTHASACGSDGCNGRDCAIGACKAKVGAKLVNRYRESMSTLYTEPCESVGAGCGSACTAASPCGAPTECNSGDFSISTLHPAAQTQPAVGVRPTSPLIANPVVSNPRSAMNSQNGQLKFNGRR